MKTKNLSKKTAEKYFNLLKEVYDLTAKIGGGRMYQDDLVKKYHTDNEVIKYYINAGVIEKIRRGVYRWMGEPPTIEMVYKIRNGRFEPDLFKDTENPQNPPEKPENIKAVNPGNLYTDILSIIERHIPGCNPTMTITIQIQ